MAAFLDFLKDTGRQQREARLQNILQNVSLSSLADGGNLSAGFYDNAPYGKGTGAINPPGYNEPIMEAPGSYPTVQTALPGVKPTPSVAPPMRKVSLEQIMPHLIHTESTNNPKAVSPKGALGLTQVMPETGKEFAKKLGMKWEPKRMLTDPAYNVTIGKAVLSDYLKRFNGDLQLALAAYNGGPGRVSRLLEDNNASTFDEIASFLPEETQNYVPKIMTRMAKNETR